MKIYIKTVTVVLFAVMTLLLSSCKDFMEIKPTDQYLEEDVFKSAPLVQSIINTVYSYVTDGAKEHSTSGLTDDAYFTHNYGQIAVNESTISESDLQWYNNNNCPFNWKNCYKGIYYANVILSNIDNVPPKPGYDINYMKGETLFLRAYLYSQLLRAHGGIPLITDVYSLKDASTINIERSDIKTCLEFIIKDLDAAIPLLIEKTTTNNLGRATKGAALSLKARIILHVASPLFTDKTINTLPVNQYKGDPKDLYESALSAAKQVINSGTYSLVDCRGENELVIANKYHTIAITNNTEMIFTKQFDSKSIKNDLPRSHGPNGYHCWSGTTPTQDLAMHFELEDGSLSDNLTKVGDYQKGNPYKGREPRFYATIGFDGSEWGRARPSDAFAFDQAPLGELQCGYYEIDDGGPIELVLPDLSKINFNGLNGIDTRHGPIEDWNGSWTGYYEKKLIDLSIDGQNFPQLSPWPYIRLAEIYLIAAEAAIELGRIEEATTYLDAIRGRIGRPDTKTTLKVRNLSFNQENMRTFLRHERRSELTYEDSRFYDIRRWMIANETCNKELCGMLIYARLKAGKSARKPYSYNEEVWDYHYHVKTLSFREKRKWENKMYFAPIKRDELKRNPALSQNPGYD